MFSEDSQKASRPRYPAIVVNTQAHIGQRSLRCVVLLPCAVSSGSCLTEFVDIVVRGLTDVPTLQVFHS